MAELMYAKTFTERLGYQIAIADLCPMYDDPMLESFSLDKSRTWYMFNRINVPEAHRRKGLGTLLLKRVLEWVGEQDYCLFCHVSPSGDLQYHALRAWYIKHGFALTCIPDMPVLCYDPRSASGAAVSSVLSLSDVKNP